KNWFSTCEKKTSVQELCTYGAVWHKSCHLIFANSKLERAQHKIKRKSMAKKAKRQVSNQNVYIFCDEQGNNFHQVLTLEVDRDVNELAVQMQDSQMIAKLAEGDIVAIEAKYHSRGTLLFKLSSIHDLYVSHFCNFHVDKSVNKISLKNQIMKHYHGAIQEQTDGKNAVLVFNQSIKTLLKDALQKK
ncbi:hypothetical protein P5673_012849, partial [Acropora cervicornis]